MLHGHTFKRLPSQWCHPIPLDSNIKTYQSLNSLNINRYCANWGFEIERVLGIVIHKLIENICQGSLERWQTSNESIKKSYVNKLLANYPIPLAQQQHILDTSLKAVSKMLDDEFGRWLLTAPGQVEYKLQTINPDAIVQTYIIDRLIETNEELWIIDFKTAMPKDTDHEKFIRQQIKKHKEQLDVYEVILKSRPDSIQKIRKILYFPLISAYTEFT